MSRLYILLAAALLPGAVLAWPWSQDMMNQPSVKPQERAIPFPVHSVPIQGIPTQVASLEEAKDIKNPLPADEASLKEGRILYRIICAACHGVRGQGADEPGDAPIGEKIGAANLITEYVQQQLTEGWIYGTITYGSVSALMPAYGVTNGEAGSNDLSPEERWHVVNYVKNGLVKEPPAPPAQQTAAAK